MRAGSFADHYSQARMFFRSQSRLEQAHMASSLVFELSKVATPHVRAAIVGHLRNVDGSLAQRVADGLGMERLPPAPAPAAPVLDLAPSPALRIIDRMKDTLQGRCIGILVAEGSNAKSLGALKAAAVDWFRDAFGHLKAIAACGGTRQILKAGGIRPDAGVVDPEDIKGFLGLAATRQWAREPKVRTLA